MLMIGFRDAGRVLAALPRRAGFRSYAFLLLSAVFITYIATIFERYYVPTARGGSETIDFYVQSYNLLFDRPASYSFLPEVYEQDLDKPVAQFVYLHAPQSHRFIGAILYALGFTGLHEFLLASCILLSLVFIFANLGLSKRPNYAVGTVLLVTFIASDQYALVMFLNPPRSVQFTFGSLTFLLGVMYKTEWKTRRTYAWLAVGFFAIWQCELIFALFCSLSFAIFAWLTLGIRRAWKGIEVSALGASASLLLFGTQLLSYKGPEIFADIWSAIRKSNFGAWFHLPHHVVGVIPAAVLRSIFTGFRLGTYDMPVDYADFVRHFLVMTQSRYGPYAAILGFSLVLALAVSTRGTLGRKFRRYLANGNLRQPIIETARFYVASAAAFLVCGAMFRGYISYLYIAIYYPLLSIVFAFGTTFLALTAIHCLSMLPTRRTVHIAASAAIVIALAAGLLEATNNAATNDIKAIFPGGRDAMRDLASLGLRQGRIGLNVETWNKPYGYYPSGVILGLTGRPGTYVPVEEFADIRRTHPELSFYLCAVQAQCWDVLPKSLTDGERIVRSGREYVIVALTP